MSAEITDKFFVKNLDCASCAAKIERGLKKAEGVEDVTVDFANLMLCKIFIQIKIHIIYTVLADQALCSR